MDVMEILMKAKITTIALVVSLHAAVCFAQESKRVESIKGEWVISNDITPVQARAKAIDEAKAELSRQAGMLQIYCRIES